MYCKHVFTFMYIPERCSHFRPLIGRARYCSTINTSLPLTQQQHPHLQQQERGSAAAAPTARIRRVQQPILHVFSNRRCDYVTCVSLFFNLREPRDFTSPTFRSGTLLLCVNMCVFAHRHFFASAQGAILVRSAPEHAGSLPVHHGASAGPGRGLWHVLWGFKVAKTGK